MRQAGAVINLPKAGNGKQLTGIPALLEDIQMMTDSFREYAHDYVFKVGERLIALKAEAKTQGVKWGEVCERLPFAQDVAGRFMKIAANKALTNSDHDRNLPEDYNTLYTLARIPEPDLEQHIEAGRIRPDMSRGEASALARGETPPPKTKTEPDHDEQSDKAASELAALNAAWRKARPSVRRQFFIDNRAWFDQRTGE